MIRFMEGDQKRQAEGEPEQSRSRQLWESVDDAVSRVVDHTSFGDLARRWRERQGRYISELGHLRRS